MKKKVVKKRSVLTKTKKSKKAKLPGYPLYPDTEDIFNKNKEEKGIVLGEGTKNKNKFDPDLTGDESDDLNTDPDEELEHMVTDDDENDDHNLNMEDQFDLGGED